MRPLLDTFWSNELRTQGVDFIEPGRYEYYYTTGNSPCGSDEQPLPNNAFYCPIGSFVSFDINWFVSYLDRHPGDMTTFLILAHEWGHAVQESWIRSQPQVDSWNPPYRKEVQADCLAGSFMSAAISQGAIIEEEGDGAAVYSWLFENGSGEWFDPGDHGTAEERGAAFYNGYHQGSSYCRANDM